MSSKETFELATKYIKLKAEPLGSPVSGGVGNFQHHYEYISLQGRKENNLDFRDKEGYTDLSSSIVLTNYVTVGIPTRPRNESVIATRFSSPGGPETLGKGARDLESDEYSPYNSLPWRNEAVRAPLAALLTAHQGPSGTHGLYGPDTASFHKVPRNTHYTIALDSDGSPYTKSVYDNEWIQNSIPYDLGTSSLTYSQETDDQTVAHTGSKLNSVLVTQNLTAVANKNFSELSSSGRNLKTIRNNNQYALPRKKITNENRGKEEPAQFFYESPVHTGFPVLSKVTLGDNTIVNVKNTTNVGQFQDINLATAYTKEGQNKLFAATLTTRIPNISSLHEYTYTIWPKAQYQYSNDSKERINWQFAPYDENKEDRKVISFDTRFGEHYDIGSIWPLDSGLFSGTLMNISSSIKYVSSFSHEEYAHGTGTWDSWRTPESSSIPYPNSENEYSLIARKLGENFSLVPEFAISPYIKNNQDSDWASHVEIILRVSGSKFGDDWSSDTFAQRFVYSDLCNLATNLGNPKNFKLVGSVIKQFKPMEECYPALRTMEIAEIFSSSLPDDRYDISPVLNTFFGPGILYNSIKGGIALHYPILTASYPFYSLDNYQMDIIPFDAIRNPYQYMTDKTISHPEKSVITTFSGSFSPNREYINAIDNFLEDTIHFFMENKSLNYFSSKKESEIESVKSGITYSMELSLDNPRPGSIDSFQCSIYNEPKSFGNSWTTFFATTPPFLINPYIPPYMYNSLVFGDIPYPVVTYGRLRINFTPTLSGPCFLSDIISTSNFEIIESTGSMLTPLPSPFKDSMQNLSSSFSTKNITKVIENGTEDLVWNINGRWECPILNFYNASTSAAEIWNGTAVYRKGMWHQYGEIPDGNNGLFLSIEDVPETSSLADLVGFSKNKRRVGEVSLSRKCTELMVMIPFYKNEPILLDGIESNFKRNQEYLDKFLFPPDLDYINGVNVKPYIFYCSEVSIKLSSEDLSRIWQNVLPGIADTPEEDTFEILEDDPNIIKKLSGNPITWMIFKVKERGKTNQNGNIGYNWPYDYFSIIELGKVDIKAEY